MVANLSFGEVGERTFSRNRDPKSIPGDVFGCASNHSCLLVGLFLNDGATVLPT